MTRATQGTLCESSSTCVPLTAVYIHVGIANLLTLVVQMPSAL